jgi:predicted PurR-regulated permease PerM
VTVIQQLPQSLRAASQGAVDIHLGTSPQDLVSSIGPTLVDNAGSIVSNSASISVALVIAALLTFFLLRDGGQWWSALLARIPDDRRQVVGESGAKAARILNGSTLGTGLVSLVAGTLQVVMMTALGLPLALPVGVLTFFGGFIPYIGGAIATGLALLIAIAFGSPATIALMAIFTVVINILIGNFIAPLVLGKTVSIHPAIVLLAAPAGAAIGGLIGMFLIVPMIAIFMATWRSVIRLFDPDEAQPIGAARSSAPRG